MAVVSSDEKSKPPGRRSSAQHKAVRVPAADATRTQVLTPQEADRAREKLTAALAPPQPTAPKMSRAALNALTQTMPLGGAPKQAKPAKQAPSLASTQVIGEAEARSALARLTKAKQEAEVAPAPPPAAATAAKMSRAALNALTRTMPLGGAPRAPAAPREPTEILPAEQMKQALSRAGSTPEPPPPKVQPKLPALNRALLGTMPMPNPGRAKSPGGGSTSVRSPFDAPRTPAAPFIQPPARAPGRPAAELPGAKETTEVMAHARPAPAPVQETAKPAKPPPPGAAMTRTMPLAGRPKASAPVAPPPLQPSRESPSKIKRRLAASLQAPEPQKRAEAPAPPPLLGKSAPLPAHAPAPPAPQAPQPRRAARVAPPAFELPAIDAHVGESLLHGAKLRGARLVRADLGGADLHGADLSHADLAYADLSGARLEEADLSSANLYKTKLDGAEMRGAKRAGTRSVDPGR